MVEAREAGPINRRKLAGAGTRLIPYDDDAACSRMHGTDAIKSVLFFAANPSGTDPLRIDRELRTIYEEGMTCVDLAAPKTKFDCVLCRA